MITALSWLALEAKHLDRAAAFYREHLGVPTVRETDREVAFDVGGCHLVLRRPADAPRGGLHTHYALAAGPGTYDAWHDRLSGTFDLHEHAFGDARSLYFYDLVGNCVEIGESRAGDDADPVTADASSASSAPDAEDASDPPLLAGVFEVVLEVADLDRAVDFYTALGFEAVDRGADRERVRLSAGSFDLELWEPHLGIADARGGVHVDLGLEVVDPEASVAAIEDRARETTEREGIDREYVVRDPDGHVLTLASV